MFCHILCKILIETWIYAPKIKYPRTLQQVLTTSFHQWFETWRAKDTSEPSLGTGINN